jgi:hypothetical protein
MYANTIADAQDAQQLSIPHINPNTVISEFFLQKIITYSIIAIKTPNK